MDIYETFLLHSTLRIVGIDSDGKQVSIGTGFLMMDAVAEGQTKAYLISNKHVFCTDSVILTFTKRNPEEFKPEVGEQVSFKLTGITSYLELHPSDDVDVACIDVSGFLECNKDIIYCRCFDSSMLATFEEDGLSVAKNAIFVGYPQNRYDAVNNLPLVRTAMIASCPIYDYNGQPIFIVDAQVYPGSSGSPVIINMASEKWKQGILPSNDSKVIVLGLIAQTMVRDNALQAMDTRIVDGFYLKEPIGLGVVFKASTIKTILDAAGANFLSKTFELKELIYERL